MCIFFLYNSPACNENSEQIFLSYKDSHTINTFLHRGNRNALHIRVSVHILDGRGLLMQRQLTCPDKASISYVGSPGSAVSILLPRRGSSHQCASPLIGVLNPGWTFFQIRVIPGRAGSVRMRPLSIGNKGSIVTTTACSRFPDDCRKLWDLMSRVSPSPSWFSHLHPGFDRFSLRSERCPGEK